MKLVKGNQDTLYEGYTTLGNFAADEQGNNLNLVVSKTHSSKGDFQPIVGTEPLTNLEKPCFGFDSESLMMDEAQSKNVFLPIESEDTEAECETQFNWRHQDNPDEKTRYSESLLSVDFFKLQESSGVIASLLSIYAGLVNPSDLEARKSLELNWITSHRYWWDIECEVYPDTSSLSFFETLQKIPTYFELHDKETQQPAFGLVLDET